MRFAAGLAAIAVLSATGCGTGSPGAESGTFDPVRSGTLTVATSDIDTPGFWEGSAEHPSGGLEYELALKLADRLGLDRVKVVIVPFDRIAAGDLGGADIALDQITPTAERAEQLDFSAPYLDAAPTVIARSGEDVPDLKTAQELRWGVVDGTTFADTIADEIDPDRPPRAVGDQAQMLLAIKQDEIDAGFLDLPVAVAIADRSGGSLEAVAKLGDEEGIAAALPNDSGNDEAVGVAMRAFMADGTIDDLLTKWVGPEADDAAEEIPLLRTDR